MRLWLMLLLFFSLLLLRQVVVVVRLWLWWTRGKSGSCSIIPVGVGWLRQRKREAAWRMRDGLATVGPSSISIGKHLLAEGLVQTDRRMDGRTARRSVNSDVSIAVVDGSGRTDGRTDRQGQTDKR